MFQALTHGFSLGTMIRDLTLPILSFFTGISFSQARFLHCRPSIDDSFFDVFCFVYFSPELLRSGSATGSWRQQFHRGSFDSFFLHKYQPFPARPGGTCDRHLRNHFSTVHLRRDFLTGSRKRKAMACCARFDDCRRPHASYVQVIHRFVARMCHAATCNLKSYFRGRDLLVDGGYTDNLPLLQMVNVFF